MIFPNDLATCFMPWDSIRILPNGQMNYCDASLEKISTQDNETDFIHWWRSSKVLQETRYRIRIGEELPGCARCRHAESIDGNSFRSRRYFQAAVHPGRFFRDSLEQNPLWNSMQHDKVSHLPSFVTVSFSNQCNSRCIMCSPDSSNLVAEDHHDFGFTQITPRLQQWWDTPSGQLKYQSLLSMVIHNPRLLQLQINGGEPFMTKIVERFIAEIVDAGKTDFTLIINTNGTVWNDDMIANMRKIDKCIVDFAVETMSESNDYLRWGSRIHEIKTMIHRYMQIQSSKFVLLLHCVPQALSVPDFHTLIDFCRDNNLLLIGNPLFFPNHLAMGVLPREIRQDLSHKLMARYDIADSDLQTVNNHEKETNIFVVVEKIDNDALPFFLRDMVIKVIKNLDQEDVPNIRDLQIKMIDHVMRFDGKHGKDFQTYFPDLANFYQEVAPCVTS